jgi:TMEM175 potassium channel family protein
MSFLPLGIFWVGQQSQLNHLRRSDVRLTWIHLAFLFAVTPTPFSTKMLREYMSYRSALIVFWANILVFGVILYASWGYATRAGLLKGDISREVSSAICRRIIIGQSCYAVGALLCIFSTYLSIAVIISVQLFYVISPWLEKPVVAHL